MLSSEVMRAVTLHKGMNNYALNVAVRGAFRSDPLDGVVRAIIQLSFYRSLSRG